MLPWRLARWDVLSLLTPMPTFVRKFSAIRVHEASLPACLLKAQPCGQTIKRIANFTDAPSAQRKLFAARTYAPLKLPTTLSRFSKARRQNGKLRNFTHREADRRRDSCRAGSGNVQRLPSRP